MKNPTKNPFDELYRMVEDCTTYEEQVQRIKYLLTENKVNTDLNATLLAESLCIPGLIAQNLEMRQSLDEMADSMHELDSRESKYDPPSNIIKFPLTKIN